MGSLPNLHELGRDHFTLVNNHHHYHPQRPNHVPIFTEEERTKILHRYSEHSRLRKIRNSINGNHDFRLNCDDLATTTIDGGGGGGGTTTISTPYSPTTSTHLKRKDSLSSSIGATSVRRLLAIVRPSTITTTSSNQMMMINHHRHHNHHHHHHDAAVNYSKRILLRNFLIFCINHLIITATFLPFLTLQTSITIWWTTIKIHLNQIYYGSLLLSIVYLFASISVLFGPYFLHKFTTNLIFLLSYLIFICYYFSHLYPIIYLLLPISIIFGIFYGLLYMTQYIYLMILSTKLCYHNNIDDNNEILDDDDVKFKRKICIIRRLARCYQAANDIGLIIGSLLTTLLIQHTISLNNQNWRITDDNNGNDTNFINFTTIPTINSNNRSDEDLAMDSYNTLLDNLFDTYEGARLCGAQACPRTITNLINQTDLTIEIDDNNNNIIDTNNNNNNNSNNFKILPNNTTIVLSIIYGCLSILTTILTIIGLDRIHTFIYQDPLERPIGLTALKSIRESFRDARLRLAAPLALFIGFEQAFIYADFAKSYVICTLGIQQLNLVFLSMGVLQAIAATTLSMLIKSIRRYYVVGVGFTFHACLLMVLILWKPIEDDPGLFYVISAAWGVCNAIWEILNFSLLTNCFTDNWESAFANLAFYRFLGLSLSFFFHGFLCNYYKLYLLSFLLVVAVVPFVWLELRLENLRKIKNMTRL